jgi:Sulfotransferase domain
MELSRVARLVPAPARPLVRRPLVRSRFVGLRASDAVLVSYPKSGSTWLRFLLAHLLTGREVDYDVIRATMPRVGRHRRAPAVLPGGGRFLRTHEPLAPFYGRPDQPVLYLVRDARDVCVSYFNHVRRQGFAGDLPAFVDRFLAGTVDGYGTWADHVHRARAFGSATEGPFLFLRYEDLRAQPVDHLAAVLAFLGVDVDRQALAEVVAANERERMRAKEATSEFLRSRIDVAAAVAEPRRWADAVGPDARERFERAVGDAMAAAGYRS